MSSLYRTILLWFVVLLAVSIGLITLASPTALLRLSGRGGPLDRINLVLVHQARDAFDQKGATGLRDYLNGLEKLLPAQFYAVDLSGRDLVSGEDRKQLLDRANSRLVRRIRGRLVRAYSAEGIHLITLIRSEGGLEGGGPYIILLIGVTAILCWLFATRLAWPVRSLARTMDQFGCGDMTARSEIRRRDEIGDLARSFNELADRMQTLLTSERRLIQDVSHELQSPLARLAVAAKLTRTAADRSLAADRLQKEITRLSEMVSGLLDITRAEGDPAVLRRDSIDLRELINDVIADCEWETGEKQCAIEARLCEAGILGDQELLRRAIENVLRNAIRYSPVHASIHVSLTVDAGTAEIAIRDHGPGVPEEALERIFVPFYRVESARERSAGGTGLGLSLAQRAVLLHQGSIQAANTQPGLRIVMRLYNLQ